MFEGFKLGETRTIILKVFNSLYYPQWIQIIPSVSDQFKFYFKKKGKLAAQQEQRVWIDFLNGVYRFFETTLQIVTESQTHNLKITAFPVMNMESPQIFPKFIDFKFCAIKSTNVKKYQLTSTIPLDFNFKFIMKKSHPYFKISPEKGKILGNNSIEILVYFTPERAETVSI